MKKILLFLIISILISGCEYFSIMSKKEWSEKSGNEDNIIIYIAGWYDTGGPDIPCYWKIENDNQEQIDLQSSNDSQANSIYVVGDNVYACGYDTIGNRIPCFWKNEKIDYFDDDPGFGNDYANQITVLNGIIFASGTSDAKASYWINKNKSGLYNSVSLSSFANSIFVQQNSSGKHIIYTGGRDMNIAFQSCYWKDDEINFLPPTPNVGNNSQVKSIQVVGNTVYSAGYINFGMQESCYWKNDTCIVLDGMVANSIFISGDDVYTAGETPTSEACYWKNNDRTILPSSLPSLANSIYVYNNKAYIAGEDNGRACYWINEKQIFLSTLTSSARSIFIKF